MTMVPATDQPFFAASTGAAAALLGLLFVAVSIAPERTVGAGATVERQMVAENVFTALVNAFFVSMAGTVPEISLGSVALALSAFAVFQTLYTGRRLWPSRFTVRSAIRRLALVAVALTMYGLQLSNAVELVRRPTDSAAVGGQIGLIFALYALALGRSWELLGARRGILAGRLSPTFDEPAGPAAPAVDRPPPPVEATAAEAPPPAQIPSRPAAAPTTVSEAVAADGPGSD
jgi:hypothetical protein